MVRDVGWRGSLYGAAFVLSSAVAAAQQGGSAPSADPIVVPSKQIELIRFADDVIARARAARDLADSRATLEAIIASPRFERLDTARQRLVLVMAGTAAYQADEAAHAHALAIRTTALGTATPADWTSRSIYALQSGDVADAIDALTRVAEQSPDQLVRVSETHLTRAVRAARDLPDPDANLAFLSRLFDLEWRHQYRGERSDWWRELALLRVARGELDEARVVVARIADPGELVRARADRRFDPLLSSHPELFDVAAAAAREVRRLEEVVRAEPDVIEPILVLGDALDTANRCEDALRVVDQAIARASGPTAEERPFRDGGRYFPWLLDSRARFLACLGRWEDALRQRVQAAALAERGQPNTSQVIFGRAVQHARASRGCPRCHRGRRQSQRLWQHARATRAIRRVSAARQCRRYSHDVGLYE